TAAFDFGDIERVEVLRGPQGTLFGKNATAGAIVLTSRAPTFTAEGSAELSYGSYDFVQAKAAVSGPLAGDTLAARLAVVSTRRDGVIANVRTGRDHNGIGNQAIRGQLLWRPRNDLAVRLIGDASTFDSNCCTQVYVRVAQRPATLRAASRQYPALAAGQGAAGQGAAGQGYAPPSLNPYDRVTDIDADLGVATNEGGVSAIVDLTLGSAILTSVAAWRFWNWDAANDRDYTGLPIQTVQHIPSRQDQYSQELRLASNGDGRIGYVAGLYVFRQRVIGRPISVYGPLAAYWLIGPTTGATATPVPGDLLDGYGTDGRTDFRSNSYAAFAEANWRALHRLTLTAGLRYTYERKTGSYDTFVFGGRATSNAALTNARFSILRGQNYEARVNDGSVAGRANAAYRLGDGVMAYASVARGAKSGGINMSGLPLDDRNLPALGTAIVGPEQNVAYEIGLKSQAFGRRLTLNIDAFYTRVTDFQANVTDTRAAAALRTYPANIPRVIVKGAEADARVWLARRLSLRASVAYADGRYASYASGPCPIERIGNAAAVCEASGRPLPGLPKWAYGAGGDYDARVGAGSVFVHVDATARTSQRGDPTGSAFTILPGYTLVDASIGYRMADVEIALFARNLLDAQYLQNVTVQAGNSGLIVGTPGDPRVIGLTLRARR
ncbi:MAG TPA: TonB-dependent receptor, partial [Sphingomonas sp.]|nr:TonB-dependent receptor [Sphingomonas sp.]